MVELSTPASPGNAWRAATQARRCSGVVMSQRGPATAASASPISAGSSGRPECTARPFCHGSITVDLEAEHVLRRHGADDAARGA